MEIDEDQNINIQRYWELDDKKVIDEKNDLVRVVHQKFDESVKMHLISDVGISSFLSGGLDSSLVSVIAKNILIHQLIQSQPIKRIKKLSKCQKMKFTPLS